MKQINVMTKAFFRGKVFIGIICCVVIAAMFATGYLVSNKAHNKVEEVKPELVDTRALKAELIESSELTTAKLNLTCMSDFKDTGVVILNKADFIMVYDVTVRAGIDMEKVDIPEDKIDNINKVINVSIPRATIQSANVDPATIKYFDEHFALFNVNEKEDANKAQELAQEDAMKKAVDSGILEMADNQSAALIKGILSNAIPDGYTIEIAKT